MHLMYIDESGDTIPLSQKGKKFLVLTGCILHESSYQEIESGFRSIKTNYYQDPDIEVKSNFLRYANPELPENSPLKLNSREKYDELEKTVAEFMRSLPVTLYSVVIDKELYWNLYPSQNPYNIAYVFLLERFQKYLKSEKSLGICIIDPREGQVEKHFIGNELSEIHNKMRWQSSSLWSKCPSIVEKLLFSQSDKTVGIQLADLFCYPVFNVFEYNKKAEEYWRYNELSEAKLFRDKTGKLDGYGLKVFPEETKKGLRFFN